MIHSGDNINFILLLGENIHILGVVPGGVAYREAVNFKEKFERFVELGVGGLKKEIEELYRRAFVSRSKHLI